MLIFAEVKSYQYALKTGLFGSQDVLAVVMLPGNSCRGKRMQTGFVWELKFCFCSVFPSSLWDKLLFYFC